MLKGKGYSDHFRKNFTLAYPVMLSQLGHVMVGVADNMMVGRLGAVSLAAASLGNAVFFMLLTFGIGVSYAITPLVAEADGEGNKEKIIQVLKHGLVINGVTGVILFVLVLLGGQGLYFMNQPIKVVEFAIPYLAIITFSIVPFMFFQTFRQFAEGLSNTKQAMYITVSSNIINVVLNYIFIYGKLGFPAMGLLGAGYATLVSRIVMAIAMGLYIYRNKRFTIYRGGFYFGGYMNKMFKKMLNLGIPAGMQFSFEVSAFAGAAIMIGWISAEALAAHQIAINLAAISYMMASGLSAAATIRVGNQLGRKDIVMLRRAGFSIYMMVTIFMLIWAVIFIVGRYFLPSLYIDNQMVIEQAAGLIIIAGLFQLSDGIQVVSLGVLRGLSDVKIPTWFTFIAYWGLGLPIGYYLGFVANWGAEGIWYGLLIGLSAVGIALFIRFNILTKKLLINGNTHK
ncbi:MAG: MATE family efflux transporter [Cyclobacteriaceae bacterium]|nr:MATE family efflux transporter [Cyclobacteriaceae bacterium]